MQNVINRLLIILLIAIMVVGCSEQQAVESLPTVVEPTAAPTVAEQATALPTADATAVPTVVANSAEFAAIPNTRINLNNMTEDDLLSTIPDFGSRMVREFFEYQPYISIQQFRREIGKYVDDAQVAAYEQYIYVPVDVDESDAATLMQIPGVDEALAEQLMNARPYGSNQAFLDALGQSLSAEQIAVAAGYLAE